MKKLSLILAGALLLGGISFATPHTIKQVPKAPISKPGPVKPVAKPGTKPAVKPATKPGTKPTGGDRPPVHHGRTGAMTKRAGK